MKFNTEQFFRCLADPMRLNIALLLMHEQELCTCHLAGALQVTLSKASRNLVLMRNKGLVKERREELWLHYRINDDLPEWSKALLDNVYQGNQHRLAAPLSLLQDRKSDVGRNDAPFDSPQFDETPKRDNDEYSVSMHS